MLKTLIHLREEQILSRQELADVMGVSNVTIGRYERGERRPTVDILPRYAKALGCSIDELLEALPERKRA